MPFLVLKAYWALIYFDVLLARGSFKELYDQVRRRTLGKPHPTAHAIERVCAAVDTACIWYWKEARCLQRSAAVTYLLRKHGVSAQMVIGTQLMPFKAHAWVEAEGAVVNDKPYVTEMYVVIDRC